MQKKLLALAALGGASWLVAASTGCQPPTPVPVPSASPSPTAKPSPGPSPSPTASTAPAEHLYMANGSGGNLLEYTAPFKASSSPTVTITIGGNVWGVAANAKYVAAEDSKGFIYVFAAPLAANASPVAQFQGPPNGAQLLFDAAGNLYSGSQGSTVLEYAPPFSNASTPKRTLTGDAAAFSLATDYSGNLYVGNLGMNQIDLYASGSASASLSLPQPGTYALASYATYLFGVDAMSGKIDAFSLPLSVTSTPAYAITNQDPHAVAIDQQGTLYVGDQHGGKGSGSIDVYAQPLGASSAMAYSITAGVVEPVELAIGP